MAECIGYSFVCVGFIVVVTNRSIALISLKEAFDIEIQLNFVTLKLTRLVLARMEFPMFFL